MLTSHGARLPSGMHASARRRRPPAISAAVVGGTPASPAIRRHHVLLEIFHSASSERFYCGGSILSKRHLLSAAHCIFHPVSGGLATGVSAYLQDARRMSSTPRFPARLFVHRDYKAVPVTDVSVYSDDVVVLEFVDDFDIDENDAILLGTAEADVPTAGDIVFGVGFGQIFFNGPLSNTLLQVRLRMQDFTDCEAVEPTAFRPHLDKSVSVCATDPGFPDRGGRDTCNGDSGGALYWFPGGSSRPVQIGITSWASTGCAGKGTVGWYTRLPKYAADVQTLVQRKSGDDVASVWTSLP